MNQFKDMASTKYSETPFIGKRSKVNIDENLADLKPLSEMKTRKSAWATQTRESTECMPSPSPSFFKRNTTTSNSNTNRVPKDSILQKIQQKSARFSNKQASEIRLIDKKNERRLNPLEYRGANLSDCMYATSVSFKAARRVQSPNNKNSPDANYPIGGG